RHFDPEQYPGSRGSSGWRPGGPDVERPGSSLAERPRGRPGDPHPRRPRPRGTTNRAGAEGSNGARRAQRRGPGALTSAERLDPDRPERSGLRGVPQEAGWRGDGEGPGGRIPHGKPRDGRSAPAAYGVRLDVPDRPDAGVVRSIQAVPPSERLAASPGRALLGNPRRPSRRVRDAGRVPGLL